MSSAESGMLLVAMPMLTDPNFRRSIVYLFEHDAVEGSVGVVINTPSETSVEEVLPELAGAVGTPGAVFVGGPVQPEIAITVDLDADGVPVIVIDRPPRDGCRVFSGYAGWGPGQLDAEIAEGAWLVVTGGAADVMSARPDRLWGTVLRRQPDEARLLATYPDDVRSN